MTSPASPSSPSGDVHLRDLRYFVAVADAASFTRAAEALFVSQPALSKQVRALETRLGVRLLDRVPSGLALTPEGAALLPHAWRMVEEWAAVRAEVRRAGAAPTLLVGLQTTGRRDVTSRLRAAAPGGAGPPPPAARGDPGARGADAGASHQLVGREHRARRRRRRHRVRVA